MRKYIFNVRLQSLNITSGLEIGNWLQADWDTCFLQITCRLLDISTVTFSTKISVVAIMAEPIESIIATTRKWLSAIKSSGDSNTDFNLCSVNIYAGPHTIVYINPNLAQFLKSTFLWDLLEIVIIANPLWEFGIFRTRKLRIFLKWWEWKWHKIEVLLTMWYARFPSANRNWAMVCSIAQFNGMRIPD